jgi:hypothetical protein
VLTPWSFLAGSPSPPATTVAGIWPASSSYSVPMSKGPNCFNLNLSKGLNARFQSLPSNSNRWFLEICRNS